MDRILDDVYYNLDRPGSYGSVSQVAKHSNTSVDNARDWLKSQDTYTLHKPAIHKFKRRHVYSKNINDFIQIDLADMQSLSRYNDGNRFILVAIDVFSKRGYAQPLKGKSAQFVVPALTNILDQMFPRPHFCQFDRGTEFLNGAVQQLFRDRKIQYYWTMNNEIKASIVERFIRTVKSKLYKFFTHKNTYRWVDVLQSVIENYNNSYHTSIKMTPNEVSDANSEIVRAHLYPHTNYKPKWKYQVGQKCRISKVKHVFHKGFRQLWSEEIFVIRQRFPSNPVTYGLEDLMKEEITGRFYEEEIQPVTKDDSNLYKIEKILKTRRGSKGIEHFVRWRGYSNKFDSWVSDLENA